MRRRQSGSVSVFLVLLLAGLLSVLFAFLESARVSALRANAKLVTEQAADAVYASFQPELWKQYHLLFWEETELTDGGLPEVCTFQKDSIEKNWKESLPEKNFFLLQVHCNQVETLRYELATDSGGAAFRRQAAAWTKKSAGEELLKNALQVVTDTDSGQMEQDGMEQEAEVSQTLEKIEQALPEQKKENSEVTEDAGRDLNPGTAGEDGQVSTLEENPLTWMKRIQKNGVLALVFPEEEISNKEINLADSVETRDLKKGNWVETEKDSVTDRLLFQLYCRSHFSDATQKAADAALAYETEYLIGGKGSDKENLKVVVNRLLLMREGANLLYLETDPQKCQQAMEVALAITSALANPELAEPVKHAVLAAWAYAESISDLRILLAGGKVSVVKNTEQWHTQLGHFGEALREPVSDRQSDGLSYAGYLQLLLWTVRDQTISLRAMNLMEKNLGTQMDRMVGKMECTYEYEAQALFWNMVQIGNQQIEGYRFSETKQLLYAK